MNKTKVIVLYGGRSAEHEVSCRSASYILKYLDRNKYDISAIAIDKEGHWLPQDSTKLLTDTPKSIPIVQKTQIAERAALDGKNIVVFPIMHGTFGEDGTLQGMLDMAEVAYVGADTLGSAVGMDKAIAKKLAQIAGIPIVPYVEIRGQMWPKNQEKIIANALATLGLPVFVKPARLGSSVGITKVKKAEDLKAACEEAFKYDEKILIEKGLNVRELECAVLGDAEPKASVVGEICVRNAEFYDYDAKYISEDGADVIVPAKLEPAQVKAIQTISKDVFIALDLYGMARVDLFMEKETGDLYFNEVNTIPGFTEISQFPMLWQASGYTQTQLLDELIELAIRHHKTRKALRRSK